MSNYKEDKTSLTSELDAVLAYLDKLKPQCETKVQLSRVSFCITFYCSSASVLYGAMSLITYGTEKRSKRVVIVVQAITPLLPKSDWKICVCSNHPKVHTIFEYAKVMSYAERKAKREARR